MTLLVLDVVLHRVDPVLVAVLLEPMAEIVVMSGETIQRVPVEAQAQAVVSAVLLVQVLDVVLHPVVLVLEAALLVQVRPEHPVRKVRLVDREDSGNGYCRSNWF